MDKGTVTKHWEKIVPAPPADVHKLFLEKCWWGSVPYMPKIPYLTEYMVVQKETNPAGVGAIRQVPLGIQEEILEGEFGKYFEYTLKRKLIFPGTYHRGRVSFIDLGDNRTKVTWDINYTPMAHAFLLLPFFWLMISFFLHVFEKDVQKAVKKS